MTNSVIASSSLSFSQCADDIRFSFDGETLNIVTRKTDEEEHKFTIVTQKEETINNVAHTVLISDHGDTFYIVNNQFHREDDRPAINMRRYIFSYREKDTSTLNVWCKIWMKNGLYHRSGDKPALIFKNGDLLWMENGHFKRNPYINASIFLASDYNGDVMALCCDRANDKFDWLDNQEIQKQIDAKLFDFKYENA